ncbi:MAG: hypothetical protein ACM3S5_18840 [Rhodospirillales bacterium]
MANHTPGPWRSDIGRDQRGFGYVRCGKRANAESEGVAVARVCHVRGYIDWSEAVANANLIAAAPDLFDALQAAGTALYALARRIDPKEASGADIAALDEAERAYIAINAVLAKATGE